MHEHDILLTGDGSPTLFSSRFGETYHSNGGAVKESEYVFIECGLRYFLEQQRQHDCPPGKIHILEAGFGTGLNALLTYREQLSHGVNAPEILYETADLFPLEEEIWQKLSYVADKPLRDFYEALHTSSWDSPVPLAKGFTLLKRQQDLEHFLPSGLIDIVYYDAFSPNVQPELWSRKVLEVITGHMRNGSVFTTYSSKGVVKQTLRDLKYKVERLPGTGGKRHIIRAVIEPVAQ